jgi:hypothetical protein
LVDWQPGSREVNMKRREFLELMTATAVAPLAAHVAPRTAAAEPAHGLERPKETLRGDMRYRQLGSTKQEVSLIGLGGHHIGRQKDEKDSITIIRKAIDAGVNFMDNCWDYHDGGSELRMGKALKDGYRKKVFLMTKIDGRTKRSAARQIDESLKRLQTDVIDLLQFHEVIRLEDPDRIFAEGGALEAVLAARKAGKVRFIGFTGHKDPEAVKTFRPLTARQVRALLARTAKAAAEGRYERFKTTNGFDGTAKNPRWLGEPDEGPG